MIKKNLPNFITLLNMGCGCVAAIFAVQNKLVLAAIFVALGIFFDFFDGLVARKLRVQSEIGLQLDSLADMITSGLVPGIVMLQLMLKTTNFQNSLNTHYDINDLSIDFPLWTLIGLFITLASGFRLAKFNVDERQTSSFIGLPTPANALFILSLPLILIFQPSALLMAIILNKWFLICVTLLSCIALNAEIPLFALKFKTWNFKDNWYRYLFLLISLVLLVLFKFIAVPLIIFIYILFSVFMNLLSRK